MYNYVIRPRNQLHTSAAGMSAEQAALRVIETQRILAEKKGLEEAAIFDAEVKMQHVRNMMAAGIDPMAIRTAEQIAEDAKKTTRIAALESMQAMIQVELAKMDAEIVASLLHP